MKNAGALSIGEKLNRMAGVIEKRDHVGKDPKEMDKEAFMKMLMEQIKYQDPFNPVKNEQFSQQLAVMSQLEQQVTTNKNLEKLVMQQSNSQVAALQVVGKDIVADKAALFHEQEKSSDLSFNLPGNASDVIVNIKDMSGETIKALPIGPHNMGIVSTKWDGYTDQELPVPTGRYSFTIEARDMAGKPMDVPTKVSGRVTGVTSTQGQTVLLVGEQRVNLDDIESISESKEKQSPSQAAAPSAPVAKADKTAGEGSTSAEEASNYTDKESETAKKISSLLPLLYR